MLHIEYIKNINPEVVDVVVDVVVEVEDLVEVLEVVDKSNYIINLHLLFITVKFNSNYIDDNI